MTRPWSGLGNRRIWGATLCATLGLALSGLVGSEPALALTQPGGTLIPKPNSNSCPGDPGVCINQNEKQHGGTGDIDAVMTATISQETFSPQCQLSFTVLARGALFLNTFGWYAVRRDSAGNAIEPQLSELHVFLGCDDPVGTQKTLSIPTGVSEIGFFLANDDESCVMTAPDPLGPVLTDLPSNLFFSQRSFNSDGDGLIHLLVWQSRAVPNAFYFGWEDSSGGGDNDFDDLLTSVSGIQCAGGGEPCQAQGSKGACADGVMQCRDGVLACVATRGPHDEECNGLDDDCDGHVDQGDDLCQPSEVCVRGHCEPRCGTGEFRCTAGEVCADGVCLPADCADKSCASGSVCVDGQCRAPCDGVTCPYAQACRDGVCVDVCQDLKCDPGFVCEPRKGSAEQGLVGVCTSCDCRGCDAGQSCENHACVAAACAGKLCGPAQHCEAGACIDDCAGAVCPSGQVCDAGTCIKDTKGAAGGAGGATGTAGSGGSSVVIVINPGMAAGGASAGAPVGAGAGTGQLVSGDQTATPANGCGCQTPGASTNTAASALFGLFGVALMRGQRRASARALYSIGKRTWSSSRTKSGKGR